MGQQTRMLPKATRSKKIAHQSPISDQAARFLQIISSISDHIYVGDLTAADYPVSTYFSPHFESLTGYPTEKFMADWRFWESLIHLDDRANVIAQFERGAKSGHSEVEYRIIRADSQSIWVRDSRRIEIESNGARLMVYGVVSDIAERKQHEAKIQALTESLEQRVADRTQELSTLYEIAAIASESLELPVTLGKALDHVLAATGSRAGAIHIITDVEDVLELIIQRNLPPHILGQINFLPADNGLAQRVIANQEPLFISNLAADPRLARFAPAGAICSYLGVALRVGGRAVGLLSLFHEEGQTFELAETALLASIAGHIGVAVENAHLHRRAEQAAIMEERERLARELHDAVTQSLCSLTLFAEAGWEMAKAGDLEAIQHNFARMGETAQYALKEMRLLLHELRPLDLERNGLIGALRQRLNMVEERANIQTQLIIDDLLEISAPIEEGLYRIAQEALNNALKHAAAQTMIVHVRTDERYIELEIVDDGRGFYPDATDDMGGLGLANMRKRAELLGGSLDILSELDRGTRVKARVKIK